MSTESVVDVRSILERMRRGEVGARSALYEFVYRHMRRLAGRIFQESFPRLRNYHDVTSVVHEVWIKLDKALAKIDLASEEDFFRFLAFKIRQVLYDLAARASRQQDREEALAADAGGEAAQDEATAPLTLAQWTEFHQAVGALPDHLRSPFELHYYLELTRQQIAELLNVDRRKIHQWLVLARDRLLSAIPEKNGAS